MSRQPGEQSGLTVEHKLRIEALRLASEIRASGDNAEKLLQSAERLLRFMKEVPAGQAQNAALPLHGRK